MDQFIEIIHVDGLIPLKRIANTLKELITHTTCTHLYVNHIRYKVFIREALGDCLSLYVREESALKIG